MSEKTKEKQPISSENNKKDKDIDILKAFQILKDIPLSKISFFVILYTTIFFIIPYFAYYRFLPIDSSLTSIPLKFILLGAFGFFTMLITFSFFIFGIYGFLEKSKDIYTLKSHLKENVETPEGKVKKDYLKRKVNLDFWLYVFSTLLVLTYLTKSYLYLNHYLILGKEYSLPQENPVLEKENLIFIFIKAFILSFILFFLLKFLLKLILFLFGKVRNCIKYLLIQRNKSIKKLLESLKKKVKIIFIYIKEKFFSYFIQYLFFWISIVGILVPFLIFISNSDFNSRPNIIFAFITLFLIYISMFLFFSFILEDKYLPPIVFVTLLLPLIFMRLTIDKYVILLKAGYSFVGVSSNPSDSVLLCISKNSNVSVSPGIYKKRLSGEPPLILINSKKRFEDYICFRDVNVVWNGNNYVWITEDEKSKFLIKIPKAALLNHEVMFLPKSDTNSNTNDEERKNEKGKNKK